MTKPPVHVAFMTGSLRMGGAERMMAHTANQLSRKVKVTFLSLTGGTDLLGELDKSVQLVSFNKKKSLGAFFSLWRFLKNEKPDALISTQIHINLIAVLVKKISGTKTKIILREATTPGAQFRVFRDLKSRVTRQLVRMLYPKADAVVAICHAVKDHLLEYGYAKTEKITVIYNPVVNAHLKEGMKQELHDPFFDGPPVVISVGRLAPAKNFTLLIEAFQLLRQKTDARMIIVGDGIEKEKLHSAIERHGLIKDVKLAGKIPNPYPYLKKSSVYALTSLFEGLPNALIEAMACGVQLVSVDCPGGSREVLENGRLGKIVPMGDANVLAEAMAELLRNPVAKEELLKSARRFEEEKIGAEYLALVNKLIAEKK